MFLPSKQKKTVTSTVTVFLNKYKESTGFEPARQGKLGSPDFESGALPLCQLSITNIIIPYLNVFSTYYFEY